MPRLIVYFVVRQFAGLKQEEFKEVAWCCYDNLESKATQDPHTIPNGLYFYEIYLSRILNLNLQFQSFRCTMLAFPRGNQWKNCMTLRDG